MCCFKQAMGSPVHLNDADEPREQIRIAAPVDALQRLIQEHDDPASLLELYYWSKEPGLLECLRAFLQAPAEVRTILQDLLPATAGSDKWGDG